MADNQEATDLENAKRLMNVILQETGVHALVTLDQKPFPGKGPIVDIHITYDNNLKPLNVGGEKMHLGEAIAQVLEVTTGHTAVEHERSVDGNIRIIFGGEMSDLAGRRKDVEDHKVHAVVHMQTLKSGKPILDLTPVGRREL